MRELIANLIYEKGSGLACSVLAHRIYEHRGEIEFSEDEVKILRAVAETFLAPAACDALTALLDNSKNDQLWQQKQKSMTQPASSVPPHALW